MRFKSIKEAVARQFAHMQKSGPLFRVNVEGQTIWEAYLVAFPPGSNPIFRERTEHDCSCCRQFIRTVGNVVAVENGVLVSVWDIEINEPVYRVVADALSSLVKSSPIAGPFVHYEASAGTHQNFETDPNSQSTEDTRPVKTWDHFFVNIDRAHVKPKSDIPTWLGEQRARHDVFLRSLREITSDAIETVLDLIAQGSLYRGEEHRPAVTQFRDLKRRFDDVVRERVKATIKDRVAEYPRAAQEREQDLFAWTADASGAVSRMRNTAIGTLLTDLSEDRDLEAAVASFEAKVAPANYKRPTSLVTPDMIRKAKATLQELGLLSALDRRFATARDVGVGDVLFADRSAKKIAGDVFDEVADEAGARAGKKNLGKIEEVPIDRFLAEIVPRAESIEILFENRHQGNLVSLIAPVDPTAGRIFKWGNLFSWAYSGEVADAIRERVKAAGGSVVGDLCCRLAWGNTDDLDFHMEEPGGYKIFFGNRNQTSPFGGRLDVDMNVSGETREPVENIFYANRKTMKEGTYHLFVNQFNQREMKDVGFECEIDWLGAVHRFAYAKPLRSKENVTVAKFRYTKETGIEILESLPESQAGRLTWGIQTQSFHKVRLLLNSPNHWEGQAIGNRHLFFVLEGCVNDGSARGFFNEFLRADLDKHRKVFEVVGSKMKPEGADEQLSGLGFSSTRRDSVTCRVKGSFNRTIKVTF